MYTISKEFHFAASHTLEHLPKDHPCSSLHGHNYIIIVEFCGGHLNKVGFIIDYRDLQPIKDYIDGELDHKHLNDVFDFNPTAELMAEHLLHTFRKFFEPPMRFKLSAVIVKETPKTIARYDP